MNINIRRGYPSYFFIRCAWDESSITQEYIKRPSIQSVEFRLFDQENPFTSKLVEDDLYYLCRKNCHKYCKFQDLWDRENALLLKLEDVGLITEKFGYPYQKRLELEIKVTWASNTDLNGRKIKLRTVCIYENQEFQGDVRSSEFVEIF